MSRIGLLGGSFNPVHRGHIAVAQAVLLADLVDIVLFLPADNPPHKQLEISFETRCRLIELAIHDYENMSLSRADVNAGKKTYTYDLICRLQAQYPHDTFKFIIGTDNVLALPFWYQWPALQQITKFLVVTRSVDTSIDFQKLAYGDCLEFVDMPAVDVSSCEIRHLCALQKDFSSYVIPSTYQLIKRALCKK